jgi:outer membrane lipoprotein-sorting protein/biotin operon repressor
MKKASLAVAVIASITALPLFANFVEGVSLPKITLAVPESLLVKAGSDGTSQVKSMLERTRQMKAYSFDSVLYTFKNGKQIVETGKLYFKSPNLIRFEVTQGGKRSGSVVVRQPDGKIRGKMGGALSGIKVVLSPDSRLLKAANGFSVLESDLGSLLSVAVERLKDQNSCLTGSIPEVPMSLIELVSRDGSLISRMTVDVTSKLPEEWSLFEGGKLFSTVKFSNLKMWAALPDSFFKLEGEGRPSEDSTQLLAHDRGISMSPTEYRLRLQEMKGQPLSCERLAEELKCFVGPGADSVRLTAIRNAINSLRLISTKICSLELPLPLAQQEQQWAAVNRSRIVFSISQLELLLSALQLAQPMMEERQSVQCAEKWGDSLSACREQVWKLYDEIDRDSPDVSAFDRARQALKESVSLLDIENNAPDGRSLE